MKVNVYIKENNSVEVRSRNKNDTNEKSSKKNREQLIKLT